LRGVRRLSQTARNTGAVEMRYVIVAKSPAERKTPTSRLVTGRDVAAPCTL